MNIFFRILLPVYSFCMMVLFAIFVIMTLSPVFFDSIYTFISKDVFGNSIYTILMLVISILLGILSLAFLIMSFKRKKDKKSVTKQTNLGEVKISLKAIENISLSALRTAEGIRSKRAFVKKVENNVSITISIVVFSEVNIPSLSLLIQESVKRTVEEDAGINVNGVEVMVDNVAAGAANK